MPDLMGGAITAEDLEASFLSDPSPRTSDNRPKLPPGFGGPIVGPPHPMVQQQLLQRQRQLSGDILGIQGLANLGLGDLRPPGPPAGAAPFGPGPFGPMILPYRLPPGPGPAWPSLGPVLFPGDPRLSLLHPGALDHLLEVGRVPASASNPLPIPSGQPITPEPVVAEGSPMTPPNLHGFHFQD